MSSSKVSAQAPSGAALDVVDPRLIIRQEGLRGYWDVFLRRVRGGELGALPVVIGLVLMAGVFQSLAPTFLSPGNISNLTLQIASTGLISIGVVLVLLLGEIDLSVGSVSGFTAAIMAVMSVKNGQHPILAMAVAVAVGALIGVLQGTVFAKVGVPSFVVTLAGLIGWQGALLYTLGETGTVNIPYDGAVAFLANTFFPPVVGYLLAAVPVLVYLLVMVRTNARRARAGLPTQATMDIALRIAGIAVIGFVVVYVLNLTRGVPLALVIFVGFVIAFDLLLRKTRYGRQIFAVGGNAEAARRAGINVDLVRISVFAIASAMAAVGGLMAAARLFAVNQASGGGDVLLNAIAAAVIGGTSLFGGRGSTWSALLGMLVIGSIQSGILLLDLQADAQYMITGAVLLVAVIVDSLSRRGRMASGRA
ncbi:ABC transporter permease [Carbonactinospora thermoautotrophica]|uniref:Xylose transport system permease protein XylH n=1 Tax=Carbonactinospora thermoautotrophica TaxID=1469144 RepID=A0A132MRE4_9ACTN|nr:ABC transporter permease [Carbonactinospora thermoautotrophica]KWX00364.1 ABC transporter permease [Carbonactinospora thermoautotrophica]KWX06213.1 ABC transporter permease [Carbonactinospora thermoautotrophica]MCX9190712.1 ABC transporter permease [Carbonactinospora thermoautotrophica]